MNNNINNIYIYDELSFRTQALYNVIDGKIVPKEDYMKINPNEVINVFDVLSYEEIGIYLRHKLLIELKFAMNKRANQMLEENVYEDLESFKASLAEEIKNYVSGKVEIKRSR